MGYLSVSIIKPEILKVISKGLYEAKQKNPVFEPRKYEASKGKTDALTSVYPEMLLVLDKFRTLNWKKIKMEVEESGIFNLISQLQLQNH